MYGTGTDYGLWVYTTHGLNAMLYNKLVVS